MHKLKKKTEQKRKEGGKIRRKNERDVTGYRGKLQRGKKRKGRRRKREKRKEGRNRRIEKEQ